MGISDGMFTGDVWRVIQEINRKIDNLTSGRRLEDASIGARGIRLIDEGGMTINGGFLRMTDETGSVGFLYFGPNSTGSGRVWQFSFPSGEVAFGLLSSSGDGFWGGNDHAGNLLVSNDAQSGVGLARPYLNIPMVPSAGTSVVVGGPFWPAFTNVSYQEVFHCITTLWHPRISIGVGTNAPSGTVDWQLQIDGVLMGSNSGTTSGTYTIPGWGSTIKPDGSAHSVQLWARNTAGVQSRVIVDRCYSLQS